MGGGLGAAYEMTDLIQWWSIDELIYCKSSAVLLHWGIDTIKGAATISWTITLWSFKCTQKWLSQSSPPCSSLHLQALAQQRLSNSKRQAEIRKKEKKRKENNNVERPETEQDEKKKINSWHKVDCTYCTLSGGRQPRLASCQVLRTTSTERQTDGQTDRQRVRDRVESRGEGGGGSSSSSNVWNAPHPRHAVHPKKPLHSLASSPWYSAFYEASWRMMAAAVEEEEEGWRGWG